MSYKLAKKAVQDLRELMQGKTGICTTMCHKHTFVYRYALCCCTKKMHESFGSIVNEKIKYVLPYHTYVLAI